jgi:hypothetical protein
MHQAFPSASVTKAMLAMAIMRAARERPLSAGELAVMTPMITESDNDSADQAWSIVGDAGLVDVAEASGMRNFAPAGYWANAGITPADQAHLFARLDRVTPARHRRDLRRLLTSVVPSQRWGIPRAAPRRADVLVKGGWRDDLAHQVARVEARGESLSLAVLTDGNPPWPYGPATIEGIARRVLR